MQDSRQDQSKRHILNDRKIDILLSVRQSQHEEAMGHTSAICSAFSLSVAGLLAMMAGVVAANSMPNTWFRLLLALAVAVAVCFIVCYMLDQRRKSDEARIIQSCIETELELCTEGRYLSGKSVLPPECCRKELTEQKKTGWSLTQADRYLVPPLISLGVLVILVILLK